MKTPRTSRLITISYRYHERLYTNWTKVPQIRLCGAWLKKAGFDEGTVVEVEIHDNQLIIKKVSQQPDH
jgi:hypothetical protein